MRPTSVGLTLILAFVALALPASAEDVPFDDPRWRFEATAAEVVEHLGRQALRLEGGRAWLPAVELVDGVVEFEMAFGPERGFSGGRFRMTSPGDFEHFYLRPHQSGMPDASQYTPVVQGVSAWQLYHGLEYAAPFVHRYDAWIPVRIVFASGRAAITVDGETLHVDLKRPVAAGSIGVDSGFAPAWFSSFRYETTVPAALPAATTPPAPPRELPPGLVRTWRVSEALESARLPALALAPGLRKSLAWKTMPVEPEGLVNLAWADGVDAEHRVVLAETTLTAEAAGPRVLHFGYSDTVRVFVAGREIYRGTNAYQSRDYRYLGTIGLFDAIVVPLEKGENVITFAVAESFGGWGVMAAWEPSSPAHGVR